MGIPRQYEGHLKVDLGRVSEPSSTVTGQSLNPALKRGVLKFEHFEEQFSLVAPHPVRRPADDPLPKGRGRDPRLRALTSRLQAELHDTVATAWHETSVRATPPLLVLPLLVGEDGPPDGGPGEGQQRFSVPQMSNLHNLGAKAPG
jgi:hypothetical protein